MKVVFIISQVDRWINFEWMADGLSDYDLHFVLLNPGDSYFERFLIEHNLPVERVNYQGKRNLLPSIRKTYKILKRIDPNVVHTHFLDANLVGLTAAWLVRIPKRIHTRHHSVFHHRYSKKGVLYDRLSNALSTDIVAISRLVEEVLREKEKVDRDKIKMIHHGFELAVFSKRDLGYENTFKSKYAIPSDHKIIGVVARYIEWKGIQYIIEAFKSFQVEHPETILCLFNARGPYKNVIRQQLKTLPKTSYREIDFEENILKLYPLFSAFVHTPIDEEVEAFGQVYVEALASGVPAVVTLSGIAKEFIEDRKNALVVPHKNSQAINEALEILNHDKDLKTQLKKNALLSVKIFSNDHFCQKLKELYEA